MGIGLTQIKHLKLPVEDVQRDLVPEISEEAAEHVLKIGEHTEAGR